MAQIVEVSGERRLQLSGEEIVRTMNWKSAWNKIRIGVRWGFNGIQSIGTYAGGIGICAGPSGYLASFTTYYAGEFLDTAHTYTAAAGPYFQSATSSGYTTVKQGSTVTQNAGGGTQTQFIGWAPSNLSQYMLEITKTGTDYLFKYRCPSSAIEVVRTILVYDFLRNIENEQGTLVSCSGVSGDIASKHRTIPDQYQFDTISLFHNKVIPTLEIGNLEVFRFE